VGKNPAGYLVASIRADYQAPNDFPTTATEVKPADPSQKAEPTAAQARAERVKTDDAHRAREATLRAAWDKLPDSERDEIMAAVKAENPGLSRFRKLLEPLYLAALEARLTSARQKTLFDAE
jgi:hypothetical protein